LAIQETEIWWELMAMFSKDFTSRNIPYWRRLLSGFAGKPSIQAIEIGVLEGRSTLWFLQNILTHESSRILCVDPRVSPEFFDNVKPYRDKVHLVKARSQDALRSLSPGLSRFDFIYVDGDHRAPSVLEDAVLSFSLLRYGGILIFDDYTWEVNRTA